VLQIGTLLVTYKTPRIFCGHTRHP
jgi:hypothetical protein